MDNTEQAVKWLSDKRKVKDTQDPLVIYYFINKSLKMSAGKVAVQTARAGMVMYSKEHCLEDTHINKSLSELFEDSFMHGNKSITLKANSSQMNRILNEDLNKVLVEISEESGYPLRLYPVYDVGATEVPTNSLTVIALTPAPASVLNKFTKKFQLYQ